MSGPTRERPTWSRRRVDARGDSADRMKIDLWRCVRPSSPRVGSTEAILEKTPCPETRGKARKGVGALYYMGVWRSKTKHHLAFRGETRYSRWTRRFGERGGDLLSGRGSSLRASSPSSGRSQTSLLTQNRHCAVVLYRCFYIFSVQWEPSAPPRRCCTSSDIQPSILD
ncbi:hypothetical protein CH063_10123 [Colletotrichum higginsianum]|uniref:Uncharacterized protein n=1 Tax=Colletotrichum higginsianum (strain IMI 349063) TaxID=759273 RepID=H1VG92_COLHI|nr:hypothetical protein CH063_10123 [Colletotrichum higginsianum]